MSVAASRIEEALTLEDWAGTTNGACCPVVGRGVTTGAVVGMLPALKVGIIEARTGYAIGRA